MNVYRVVPDGVNWAVDLDGLQVARSPRRFEAIDEARRLAEANRPSEVVVYGFDGDVDERCTYAQEVGALNRNGRS
jgi:hypothetical protein